MVLAVDGKTIEMWWREKHGGCGERKKVCSGGAGGGGDGGVGSGGGKIEKYEEERNN